MEQDGTSADITRKPSIGREEGCHKPTNEKKPAFTARAPSTSGHSAPGTDALTSPGVTPAFLEPSTTSARPVNYGDNLRPDNEPPPRHGGPALPSPPGPGPTAQHDPSSAAPLIPGSIDVLHPPPPTSTEHAAYETPHPFTTADANSLASAPSAPPAATSPTIKPSLPHSGGGFRKPSHLHNKYAAPSTASSIFDDSEDSSSEEHYLARRSARMCPHIASSMAAPTASIAATAACSLSLASTMQAVPATSAAATAFKTDDSSHRLQPAYHSGPPTAAPVGTSATSEPSLAHAAHITSSPSATTTASATAPPDGPQLLAIQQLQLQVLQQQQLLAQYGLLPSMQQQQQAFYPTTFPPVGVSASTLPRMWYPGMMVTMAPPMVSPASKNMVVYATPEHAEPGAALPLQPSPPPLRQQQQQQALQERYLRQWSDVRPMPTTMTTPATTAAAGTTGAAAVDAPIAFAVAEAAAADAAAAEALDPYVMLQQAASSLSGSVCMAATAASGVSVSTPTVNAGPSWSISPSAHVQEAGQQQQQQQQQGVNAAVEPLAAGAGSAFVMFPLSRAVWGPLPGLPSEGSGKKGMAAALPSHALAPPQVNFLTPTPVDPATALATAQQQNLQQLLLLQQQQPLSTAGVVPVQAAPLALPPQLSQTDGGGAAGKEAAAAISSRSAEAPAAPAAVLAAYGGGGGAGVGAQAGRAESAAAGDTGGGVVLDSKDRRGSLPSADLVAANLAGNIKAIAIFDKEEDDDEGGELEDEAKPSWYQQPGVVVFLWSAGLGMALLVVGIILHTRYRNTYDIFRWCYFFAAMPLLFYGLSYTSSRVFRLLEWWFFRESLLYLDSVQRSALWLVFFLTLLPWYHTVFRWAWCKDTAAFTKRCSTPGYLQATQIIWKVLLCFMIFSLANLLKAVLAKLLSTHFYRTAHFKKLKKALEKEYMLQVLSRPCRSSQSAQFAAVTGEQQQQHHWYNLSSYLYHPFQHSHRHHNTGAGDGNGGGGGGSSTAAAAAGGGAAADLAGPAAGPAAAAANAVAMSADTATADRRASNNVPLQPSTIPEEMAAVDAGGQPQPVTTIGVGGSSGVGARVTATHPPVPFLSFNTELALPVPQQQQQQSLTTTPEAATAFPTVAIAFAASPLSRALAPAGSATATTAAVTATLSPAELPPNSSSPAAAAAAAAAGSPVTADADWHSPPHPPPLWQRQLLPLPQLHQQPNSGGTAAYDGSTAAPTVPLPQAAPNLPSISQAHSAVGPSTATAAAAAVTQSGSRPSAPVVAATTTATTTIAADSSARRLPGGVEWAQDLLPVIGPPPLQHEQPAGANNPVAAMLFRKDSHGSRASRASASKQKSPATAATGATAASGLPRPRKGFALTREMASVVAMATKQQQQQQQKAGKGTDGAAAGAGAANSALGTAAQKGLHHLTDLEIEKVRTAIVIKTQSALISKYAELSDEEMAKELGRVKRFSKALFYNALPPDCGHRDYLIVDDFVPFFEDPEGAWTSGASSDGGKLPSTKSLTNSEQQQQGKEGGSGGGGGLTRISFAIANDPARVARQRGRQQAAQAAARKAFAVFDANNNGQVSRLELRDVVVGIYMERRNMARSLMDTETIVQSLGFCIGVVIHFVFAALYLLIWGVDILTGFSTFSATVLALTFMFGNSVKNMFESMLFLFVTHPYDVGDCVVIGTDMYRVKKLNLLYTDLVKFTGERVYMPNTSLITQGIANWTRSKNKSESCRLVCDIGVAWEVREDIQAALRAYAKEHPGEFDGEPSCNFRELVDPLKVALTCSWNYNFAPDDFSRLSPARNGMLFIVQSKAREHNLHHTT